MIASNAVDLKALKESIDLLALIRSRGYQPKRHGHEKWKIPCPFHSDEEASLVITPHKNLWHCFGCDRGGSSIDWIKELDGLSTREAILKLADESNGVLIRAAEIPRRASREEAARTPQQQQLLNKVAAFYHKALFGYPEGRAYLKERGLNDAALFETFKIGFANETIHEALPSEAEGPDSRSDVGGDILSDLKAIGILDHKGKEHFRDCVVFPIFDEQGNVTEMYGRKICEVPSSNRQSAIGSRQSIKHLYLPGPHRGVWNWQAARLSAGASRVGGSSSLLLTESVIDAATLWQAGHKNVTACYGTNGLTEDHLKLFRQQQTATLHLVMDGDAAGREGIERMRPRLQAEGLEVHTVTLPDGEDVNSFFLNHGREEFDQLLASPRHPTPDTPREVTVVPRAQGYLMTLGRRSYDVQMVASGPTKQRSTIKAQTKDRHVFHIDTVDLYSARSRKTFVVDAAKLYREEPSVIETDLNRIIEQCEKQASKSDTSSSIEHPASSISPRERAETEKFGRRKDLLDAIAKDIEQCGYIGERANALTAYLTMTSRKMEDPLAFLIVSGSGAGKSALQDTVLSFCPPEDLVKVTSLTERALFYKDETSLKHKVLALEESAGAEDAAYAIRNLISAKELTIESTVKDPDTGRLTTMQNKVYGPTAVFETTTNPDLDPETRSRFLVTSIDESREQTRAILEAQRKARTLEGFKRKLARETVLQKHHTFQRLLKPLPVFNPFADLLTFTDERLLTRRDQPKYLALIDTVAFLHQFQKSVKQITVEGKTIEYINVSLRDIALANELALEIVGHSLDELSGPSRKLLLLTEELVTSRAKDRGEQPQSIAFTRRELREFTRWSDYQIKTHIRQLEELEYLIPGAGRQGQQYQYRLLWNGEGRDGEAFVLGLKDVEQLRKEAESLGVPSNLEG